MYRVQCVPSNNLEAASETVLLDLITQNRSACLWEKLSAVVLANCLRAPMRLKLQEAKHSLALLP